MDHIKTLFSSQAAKAWIAFIVAAIAPYAVQWLNSLTAESVAGLFGRYGLQISEGGAALVVGLAGLLAVYFTKNKPADE